VKARGNAFLDLHATLDHIFTLCIGRSRIIVSDYPGRRYKDLVLRRKVPPGETTNSYAAPIPGGDVAHSFWVGVLLVQVNIVRPIINCFLNTNPYC